jgi:hypothetical protein
MNGPETKWLRASKWSDEAPEEVQCDYLNSMDNFAAHLRDGARLLATPEDGHSTTAVIAAMYDSADEQNGGWIAL